MTTKSSNDLPEDGLEMARILAAGAGTDNAAIAYALIDIAESLRRQQHREDRRWGFKSRPISARVQVGEREVETKFVHP